MPQENHLNPSATNRIPWLWPSLGLLLAIGITTAMDASGLAVFSALPLLPLTLLFWYLQRLDRREMGLVWGARTGHALAVLYPLVVLGLAAGIALLAGGIDTSETDWRKAGLNLLLMTLTGIPMVILTEEGFFRGWLWASLRRTGLSEIKTLLWSSVAFALWHWSAVVLETEFVLPPAQIPVYLVNAALLGIVWGLLRAISGSVIVASVSHGVWNGIAYTVFGFGLLPGALGIERSILFHPEVGLTGLLLNTLYALALWRWWRRNRPDQRTTAQR